MIVITIKVIIMIVNNVIIVRRGINKLDQKGNIHNILMSCNSNALKLLLYMIYFIQSNCFPFHFRV